MNEAEIVWDSYVGLLNWYNFLEDLYYFLINSLLVFLFCHVAVDLPPWFSKMSVAFESDVDLVSLHSWVKNFLYHVIRWFLFIIFWISTLLLT